LPCWSMKMGTNKAMMMDAFKRLEDSHEQRSKGSNSSLYS